MRRHDEQDLQDGKEDARVVKEEVTRFSTGVESARELLGKGIPAIASHPVHPVNPVQKAAGESGQDEQDLQDGKEGAGVINEAVTKFAMVVEPARNPPEKVRTTGAFHPVHPVNPVQKTKGRSPERVLQP